MSAFAVVALVVGGLALLVWSPFLLALAGHLRERRRDR